MGHAIDIEKLMKARIKELEGGESNEMYDHVFRAGRFPLSRGEVDKLMPLIRIVCDVAIDVFDLKHVVEELLDGKMPVREVKKPVDEGPDPSKMTPAQLRERNKAIREGKEYVLPSVKPPVSAVVEKEPEPEIDVDKMGVIRPVVPEPPAVIPVPVREAGEEAKPVDDGHAPGASEAEITEALGTPPEPEKPRAPVKNRPAVGKKRGRPKGSKNKAKKKAPAKG